MKFCVVGLFLVIATGAVHAETMPELLKLAQQQPGTTVIRPVSGHLAQELAPYLDGGRLLGSARLIEHLEQEGCGRFEVRLTAELAAEDVALAEVRLDMCADGAPPQVPR